MDDRCFLGYELKLENAGMSRTVSQNRNYLISLSENNHVQFSLVDEDNKEKKYDIDLSMPRLRASAIKVRKSSSGPKSGSTLR